MTVKWVYKCLPAFVFEIDSEDDISMTFGNIIFLNKDDTAGVLEHELVHIRQNYRTLGFATLLYKFSQYFRLKYEVEAFKKQIEIDKVNDLRIIAIAGTIADDYKIDYVTKDDIFASLKG